jgi:hypothetical protein
VVHQGRGHELGQTVLELDLHGNAVIRVIKI